MKFILRPGQRRTESQIIHPGQSATIAGFKSKIKNLSVIFEDKGAKAIYCIGSTRSGFIKKDCIEFRKVWFEYDTTDKEYEIELSIH